MAVCHDEENICALYKTGYEKYGAARLNVNSGRLTYRETVSGKSVQFSSIAEADGEMFLIIIENGVSFVTGFSENRTYSYRFEADVRQLFVNDSRAYALTNDKKVFRLGRGDKVFCCQMPDDGKVTDAGRGYVYTSEQALVSLCGGVEYVGSKAAVNLGGTTFKSDGATLIAAAGGYFAALNNDFSCEIKDIESVNPDSPDMPQRALDNILTCAQGTTVKVFKEQYPDVVLRGKNNSELSSGKLRTGDRAVFGDKTREIAVTGDVNGTATVTWDDVRVLMKSMIGVGNLSSCERKAADMNADGSIDNRDLVLLARAAA